MTDTDELALTADDMAIAGPCFTNDRTALSSHAPIRWALRWARLERAHQHIEDAVALLVGLDLATVLAKPGTVTDEDHARELLTRYVRIVAADAFERILRADDMPTDVRAMRGAA